MSAFCHWDFFVSVTGVTVLRDEDLPWLPLSLTVFASRAARTVRCDDRHGPFWSSCLH
jgi:hypothetical protein